MKIYVCIKHVPNTAAKITLEGTTAYDESVKFVVNPYDEFAVEEGLKMTIANYQLFRPHFLGIKPVKLPFIDTLSNWVMSKKHIEIILDANNHELILRRKSRKFRRYETKEYENLQRQVISQLNGKHTIHINTTGKSIKSVHNIIVGTVNGII